MVFFSTWISISIDVVLCNIPLLPKLLSERPKRESWTCSFSNSCFGMYNCSVHCSTCCCFIILVNTVPPWLIFTYFSLKLMVRSRSSLLCLHTLPCSRKQNWGPSSVAFKLLKVI